MAEDRSYTVRGGSIVRLALIGAALLGLGLGPVNPTTMTWTAPTTNVDGTPLQDLGSYMIRLAPQASGPWSDVAEVPAASLAPAPGTQEQFDVRTLGLPVGQYYAAVLAVDTSDNASEPTAAVPFEMVPVTAPPVVGASPVVTFSDASLDKDPEVLIVAQDEAGLASVRVYVNDSLETSMTTNQIAWQTTITLPRSRHSLVRVEATDGQGVSAVAERVYRR